MRDAFPEIVAALAARRPISLSRWGDGEWHALLSHRGQNCDGQVYTAPLRDALERVLLDRPTYLLGLQPYAYRVMGPQIDAWLAHRHLDPGWIDGDVFARRSSAATLGPFLTAVRPTILVGPAHLAGLSLVPIIQHVVSPARGAFAVWPRLLAQVQLAVDTTGIHIVLLSAGMSSNLIVHALSVSHPMVSALDLGSLWEPYVGKATRSYHAAILAREQAHA